MHAPRGASKPDEPALDLASQDLLQFLIIFFGHELKLNRQPSEALQLFKHGRGRRAGSRDVQAAIVYTKWNDGEAGLHMSGQTSEHTGLDILRIDACGWQSAL